MKPSPKQTHPLPARPIKETPKPLYPAHALLRVLRDSKPGSENPNGILHLQDEIDRVWIFETRTGRCEDAINRLDAIVHYVHSIYRRGIPERTGVFIRPIAEYEILDTLKQARVGEVPIAYPYLHFISRFGLSEEVRAQADKLCKTAIFCSGSRCPKWARYVLQPPEQQ